MIKQRPDACRGIVAVRLHRFPRSGGMCMATSRADLLARPSLTLADVTVPRTGALRDAVLVLGFIVVNALLAQVSVPLPGTPVPMTLQTLAVRLTGGLLGS